MRLITDEQHEDLVAALEALMFEGYKITAGEALATLQALPEVEVVGVTNDCEISYMQSKEDGFAAMFKVGSERAHNEDGDIELYATKEPSCLVGTTDSAKTTAENSDAGLQADLAQGKNLGDKT